MLCHHMLTWRFSSNRNRNMMARLCRYRNWHGTFLLMLSFSPKIIDPTALFCHLKYLLPTISFVDNEPQIFLIYCEAKDNHAGKDYIIDLDNLISSFWVCRYKRQNFIYSLLSPSTCWHKKAELNRLIKYDKAEN